MFKNLKTLPFSTFSLLKNLVCTCQFPPPYSPVIILFSLNSIPQSTFFFSCFFNFSNFLGKFCTIAQNPINPSSIPNKDEHASSNSFLFNFISFLFFLIKHQHCIILKNYFSPPFFIRYASLMVPILFLFND